MATILRPLDKAIRQQVVSVSTSPTAMPSSPLAQRRVIVIQNLSSNIVYIGSSDVSTSGGKRGIAMANLYDTLTLEASSDISVYGIAGSTSDVSILEFS